MTNVDWFFMGFNALWILGLGLIIASLSYASYLATQQKKQFNQATEIAGLSKIRVAGSGNLLHWIGRWCIGDLGKDCMGCLGDHLCISGLASQEDN